MSRITEVHSGVTSGGLTIFVVVSRAAYSLLHDIFPDALRSDVNIIAGHPDAPTGGSYQPGSGQRRYR